MASTIENAKSALRDRVREIDDEKKRLEAALHALTSDGTSRSRPRATSGRKRKRAQRGQRRSQVLQSLRRSPGLRPAELAKKHGMANSQVSTVLRQLAEEGKVEKRKDGLYHPKKKRAARKS